MKLLSYLLLAGLMLISILCQAKLYKYSELELKNYDDMRKIIVEHIEKAKAIDMKNQELAQESGNNDYDEYESIDLLKDALRVVLSRPNKDNLLEKLIPDVRRELNNYDAYFDVINDIAVEAISGVNQKSPVVFRSTYIFILENILSELKPEAKQNKEARKVIEYIRDANLKIPNDVRLDRKLRSMVKSQSPSETAKVILEGIDGKSKKKKGFWERLFG